MAPDRARLRARILPDHHFGGEAGPSPALTRNRRHAATWRCASRNAARVMLSSFLVDGLRERQPADRGRTHSVSGSDWL